MLVRWILLLMSAVTCLGQSSWRELNNPSQTATFNGNDGQCELGSVADRFDCYPEPGASQQGCESRGCCWRALANGTVKGQLNVPYCYYPADYKGYVVDGLDHFPDRISLKLKRQTPSGIDKDVQSVTVDVYFYQNDTARITILDATQTRFTPPVPKIPTRTFTGSLLYNVTVTQDGQLKIYRLDKVVLQPTPAVTFRSLGGVLDLFVFTGPTVGGVVQQYQRVVGFPALPPYWSLGFHLCRFGYKTLNRTRYIMESNIKAGIPVDMNEPSNFYDGHKDGCPPGQKEDNPPYVPGGEKLSAKTLCMSDRHFISSHYNVHNIYSQLEARATYKALGQIRQKRPFIISRATSPGQSAWSGHWSGDISSSWEDMKLSIPNSVQKGEFNVYKFTSNWNEKVVISVSREKAGCGENPFVTRVIILGVEEAPKNVTMGGKRLPFDYYDHNK
ncbi:hypothetical protein V5799_033317, partial [Amblyomma americanum]